MAQARRRCSGWPKRFRMPRCGPNVPYCLSGNCGEEKGLWGSRYFTDYPTIPLDHIVTQLNIDMIGRSKKEGDTNPRNATLSGPNAIYVIGSTMMSTELGQLSQTVNKSYLNLPIRSALRRPADPNRFFFPQRIISTMPARAFRSSSFLTACTKTIIARATRRRRSL